VNESIWMEGLELLGSGLLGWHIRATLGLALVALAGFVLRHAPQRTRHRILAWGTLAALLLPTLGALVPETWGLPVVPPATPTITMGAPAASLGAPIEFAPVTDAVVPEAAPSPAGSSVRTGLVLLWIAGAALGLLSVLIAAIGALSLRRGAAAPPPTTQSTFDALQATAGTSARLRVTDRIRGPVVLGVWTPTVLLPRGADTWAETRLRAVLAHELGHVSQGDHRWFPLVFVARSLLWFNPLAWLVSRSFFRTAEFAADEAAITRTMKPSRYAAELLSLSNEGPFERGPLLAAAATGRPDVSTRIRRLLSRPPTMLRLRRIVPVALGLLGAWACILLARPAVDEASQSAPQASNLLAVPEGALRISVSETGLVATTARGERWSQEPGRELERHGHLLVELHAFLDGRLDGERPLVVAADRQVSFAKLIDVLYTAGRAGVRQYYFEVPTPRGPRVLSVSPPLYYATPPTLGADPDDRTQPALRVGVVVNDGAIHLVTRPSRTVPPRYRDPQLSCWLNPESLQRVSQQLCEATGGAPLHMAYSGFHDTHYGELTDAMVDMASPCGSVLVIESPGVRPAPTSDTDCEDVLDGVRIPRVR